MSALRDIAASKFFRFGLAIAVIGAAVYVGYIATAGPTTYGVNAVYSSAPGLFPGAAVDVLGVKVGTVSAVQNSGNKVDVTMAVDQGTRIPANAVASLVAPQLLGAPDIDLNPGYTGGPYLAAGATMSESHTSVPVSTDEVLKELQRSLNALNPHAVGDLVSNLASDLNGQGQNLNQLIASAAGTIQLLANKGNELGQLNGTLAQLTGTLDANTSQIEQLVRQYDTVSSVIAQRSPQLSDAIAQLAGASSNLVSLLVPNLQPLEADVGTVTTVGRTLDRNLSSVDEILQQGNNLFQGAARAYDPNYNWLNLNLELSPGVTSAYVAGLVRDRLAGICRRILANHATGLAGAAVASLTQCGNPSSGFFDPLLNTIPTIINALTQNSTSASVQSLLQTGLNQILALEPANGGTASNAGSPPTSSSKSANSSTAPKSTTTTTPPHPTTTTPTSCGLLGMLLGCPASSSSGSNAKGSSSGSLLGGLLSQHSTTSSVSLATATKNAVTTASTASASSVAKTPTSSAPSLTAPDAALLGPLPQDQGNRHTGASHAHHHHRKKKQQQEHSSGSKS